MTVLQWSAVIIGSLLTALLLIAHLRRERITVRSKRNAAPGQFAQLTDGITHFIDIGPRDGEVVLLVPGATLGLWVWHDLPRTLSDAGYRIIAYDLFGRGYSDRPHKAYNADIFDRQIIDLLKTLGISEPVTLLGLAFGCPISANFAIRHPGSVRRICFFGPDGFGVAMTRMAEIVQIRGIGDLLFRLIGNKALLARLDGYSTNQKVLNWLVENYTPDLSIKGFKRALLSSIRHMPIHDARTLYARVDATGLPFMMIWGTEDHVTPVPASFDPASLFPNAEVHLLPQVGHLPHVDAPQVTNARLLAFLRDEIASPNLAAK